MEIIENLVQGSSEWLEFRRSRIMASDVPIILGKSPYATKYVLWQRKLGFAPEQKDNFAMKRGRELEPVVLDMVNTKLEANFKSAVVLHEDLKWTGASLDGLDEEKEALLEIKCPNKGDHELATMGSIPDKYWVQVQYQLFVSGLIKGYYASYNNDDLQIVEVEIDDGFIIDTVLPEVTSFYKCLVDMVEPETSEDDYIFINDEEFNHYSNEWKTAHDLTKLYSEKKKYYKNKLIEFTDDGNCFGNGVKLKRINRDGLIDWKKLWDSTIDKFPEVRDTFDPENFKKESIGFWKVSKENP